MVNGVLIIHQIKFFWFFNFYSQWKRNSEICGDPQSSTQNTSELSLRGNDGRLVDCVLGVRELICSSTIVFVSLGFLFYINNALVWPVSLVYFLGKQLLFSVYLY